MQQIYRVSSHNYLQGDIFSCIIGSNIIIGLLVLYENVHNELKLLAAFNEVSYFSFICSAFSNINKAHCLFQGAGNKQLLEEKNAARLLQS